MLLAFRVAANCPSRLSGFLVRLRHPHKFRSNEHSPSTAIAFTGVAVYQNIDIYKERDEDPHTKNKIHTHTETKSNEIY